MGPKNVYPFLSLVRELLDALTKEGGGLYLFSIPNHAEDVAGVALASPKAMSTASRIHGNSSEQDKGAQENRPQRFLPYTLPQPEDRSDGDMERTVRI